MRYQKLSGDSKGLSLATEIANRDSRMSFRHP